MTFTQKGKGGGSKNAPSCGQADRGGRSREIPKKCGSHIRSLPKEPVLPSVPAINSICNCLMPACLPLCRSPSKQNRDGWRRTDILTLEHESGILRHCWDVLKVSTVFLSGLWASPLFLFSAELKLRNEKCEVLMTQQCLIILLSCFRARMSGGGG